MKGLKAGSHTLKFENAGEQLHHLIAAPMVEGATFDQVKEFFSSEGEPDRPAAPRLRGRHRHRRHR